MRTSWWICYLFATPPGASRKAQLNTNYRWIWYFHSVTCAQVKHTFPPQGICVCKPWTHGSHHRLTYHDTATHKKSHQSANNVCIVSVLTILIIWAWSNKKHYSTSNVQMVWFSLKIYGLTNTKHTLHPDQDFYIFYFKMLQIFHLWLIWFNNLSYTFCMDGMARHAVFMLKMYLIHLKEHNLYIIQHKSNEIYEKTLLSNIHGVMPHNYLNNN